MGYMQDLYETYGKARTYVGREDSKGCILLPIAHSTQNAQLEVVVDLTGEWISARKVEKAEAVTIIPVTEDSGTRSSGIAPHPLCDKLCYVAGDYEVYCPKKKAGEFYQNYIHHLEEWVRFGCHSYANAIYHYLRKGNLVKDLVESGLLRITESGFLYEEEKIEGIPQTDSFVRFRIQDECVSGLGEVWKETELYEDYIRFYLSRLEKTGLDYITGTCIKISEKQPSKIRNSADKAKIISANDSSGFTYRGRFISKEETVGVGYVPSQEAHNALRWLIERQGYRDHGMCIVSWNPELEEIPDWMREEEFESDCNEEEELPPDLAEEYARRLNKGIRGRYTQFDNPNKAIIIMSLDAATPGRLAVTYYQKLSGSVFLDNLLHWHMSCSWIMGRKNQESYSYKPISPTLEDIINAAYGVERNGYLQVDEKLIEGVLKRLIPCIVEGKNIPIDIVKSAFESACRPLAFTEYNRRKIMDIACALIRKGSMDRSNNQKGEFYSMSLDPKIKSRDYLYGRLLATAYKLEYDTFTDEEKGKRETNADRFRSMLVKNPKKTWPLVDKGIQPYKRKLRVDILHRYEREFEEIYDLFDIEDFSFEGKLNEGFLIGYNCQLSYLRKPRNKTIQD